MSERSFCAVREDLIAWVMLLLSGLKSLKFVKTKFIKLNIQTCLTALVDTFKVPVIKVALLLYYDSKVFGINMYLKEFTLPHTLIKAYFDETVCTQCEPALYNANTFPTYRSEILDAQICVILKQFVH